MYRKIMSFLEAWKNSVHRKPLILQGARQVGKTYSILEFGRTHYENVAYFNFETNPKLNETFEENISPDYLIPILSHIAGQTIVKEKTLPEPQALFTSICPPISSARRRLMVSPKPLPSVL